MAERQSRRSRTEKNKTAVETGKRSQSPAAASRKKTTHKRTVRRQAILVLGMHRSGTSALAGVLVSLGAKPPLSLMKANAFNPKGYWESRALMEFHDRLLDSAGSHWFDWEPFNSGWQDSVIASGFADELKNLIDQEFDKARLFMVKDPRICRFVSFWLDQLNDLNITPHIVIVLRNPLEIASSLEVRNKFSLGNSLLLWLRHMLDAEAQTRHLPRSFVRYDEFLVDWRAVVNRLSTDLEITWPRKSGHVENEIDSFLTDELRNYHIPEQELLVRQNVYEWIKTVYPLFRQMADGEADNTALAKLDEVRYAFNESSRIFGPLVAEAQKSKRLVLARANELEKRNADFENRLRERYSETRQLTAKLKQQQRESKKLTTNLKALETKLNARDQNIRQLTAKLRKYENETRNLVARLKDRGREVENLTARVSELDLNIQELRNSTSWRITAPLRSARLMQKRAVVLFRRSLGITARFVYHYTPLPFRMKLQFKDILFRRADLLFRSTAAYRSWESEQSLAELHKTVNTNNTARKDIADIQKADQKDVAEESSVPGLAKIYISCWLGENETLHTSLVELSQWLRANAVNTTFITSSRFLFQDTDLECIKTDFSLTGVGARLYEGVSASGPGPWWLGEIVSVEKRWLKEKGDTVLAEDNKFLNHLANAAYIFWKDLFIKNMPDLLLVWGSSSTVSKLYIHLCHELSIPVLIIERGHFPRTMFVDLLGQFAYGGINLLPHSAILNHRSRERGQVDTIVNWVRACDEIPYSNYNKSVTFLDEIAAAKDGGRKVVLLIGVNDYGAGVLYKNDDTHERHSFLFSSSKEMFEYIKRILPLVEKEALLIYKPHPADRNEYISDDSSILIAKDMNINDLISVSDVCITLTTTALARCIAEEKPVLLLALSDISMKRIAYECTHYTEIPAMLRAALGRDNFHEKISKGRSYLEYLFSERLIGLTDDAPTRLKIRDLAEFINNRIHCFAEPEKGINSGDKTVPPCLFRVYERGGQSEISFQYRNPVTVLIPVYKNVSLTENCIESVLKSACNTVHDIIIICDRSPEEEMYSMLDRCKKHDRVTLIFNEKNLGFSGAVNRGMEYSANSDVILLNSDTIVPEKWVDRLYDAAYCDTNIATVTPLSNNASNIFTVDDIRQLNVQNTEDIEFYDQLLQQQNDHYIEVPTGHGFCMYVRRACINRIGFLDEKTFGSGYSEEVDFCLRARQQGFVNICAANVFVGHVGEASFGDKARELRLKNRDIIFNLYPEYREEIRLAGENSILQRMKSISE